LQHTPASFWCAHFSYCTVYSNHNIHGSGFKFKIDFVVR
jgi:hypothetical protein